MEKIPFDIELYNTGKYDVVSRIGLPVEIISVNLRSYSYPILAYIGNSFEHKTFTKQGNLYDDNRVTDQDILLVEKVTFSDSYVNVYKTHQTNKPIIGTTFENRQKALEVDGRLSTLKLRIFSDGNVEILETIKNND